MSDLPLSPSADLGAVRGSKSGALRTRSLAVVIATGSAIAVWALFSAAGVEPQIPVDADRELQPLGVGPVVTVALVASFAAWLLAGALERWAASRARSIWTVVAVTVFALSLLPVLSVDGAADKLALWAMHAAVAAALIPLFRRTLPAPSPR